MANFECHSARISVGPRAWAVVTWEPHWLVQLSVWLVGWAVLSALDLGSDTADGCEGRRNINPLFGRGMVMSSKPVLYTLLLVCTTGASELASRETDRLHPNFQCVKRAEPSVGVHIL